MKNLSKRISYVLFALVLLTTSCVSSKKYETALALNRDLQANRDALSQEKATLEAERSALAKEKAALEEDKNAMERSLKANLQSSNQRVTQLSTDLQTQEDKLREMQRILAEKDRAVNDLKNRVTNALLGFKAGDLTVNVKNGKVYVSLSEQLLFKSGSTKVDPKGQEALQKLAAALKDQQEVNVLVEGHTDDVSVSKGTVGMKDNWDLSVLRATEITRILTTAGLTPERVTPSGRSKYVPVAQNTSADQRALNRRTEIILTPKLDELFKILEQN
jgi:chemotaxis protein MotB